MTRGVRFPVLAGIVGLSLACLPAPRAGADEVNVAAAASLTDALKEIAGVHERRSGDRVVFNFGASSLLARQIQEGAPADLFFSADEAKMDVLEGAGALVPGTRRSLLTNRLVVVVPVGTPNRLAALGDLAAPRFRVLALAEPCTVPAGIYAKEALRKAGVWGTVANRVVPTENVRAALAAVESGNADAGLVYRTDASLSNRVVVAFEVPAAETPDISYPVALLRSAKAPAAARRFLEFLGSPEAAAIFTKKGFGVRPAR